MRLLQPGIGGLLRRCAGACRTEICAVPGRWYVVVGVAVGLGGVELRKSMLETWSPMPRVLQYSSRVYARKSTIHNSSSVRLTLPVQQQRSNTAPFLARLPGNHFIFTIDVHPTYGYEPNVIKDSAGSTSTSLRGWQA